LTSGVETAIIEDYCWLRALRRALTDPVAMGRRC
jgi:hypothetical protein